MPTRLSTARNPKQTGRSFATFCAFRTSMLEGWLIFGLPSSELAVHPSEKNNVHEFYFMCADILTFVAAMEKQGISCSSIQALGWGQLTQVTLPGGGRVGVYQPRHAQPKTARPRNPAKRHGRA